VCQARKVHNLPVFIMKVIAFGLAIGEFNLVNPYFHTSQVTDFKLIRFFSLSKTKILIYKSIENLSLLTTKVGIHIFFLLKSRKQHFFMKIVWVSPIFIGWCLSNSQYLTFSLSHFLRQICRYWTDFVHVI